MLISPVNNINNKRNIYFSQKNNKKTESDDFYKSNDFVTIPTSLFIALATMSLSPEARAEIGNDGINNTEVVESIQSQKVAVTPYKPNSVLVQYKKHFKLENQGYTMYYTDIMKNSRTNDNKVVTDIFFVKDGFKQISRGFEDLNTPVKFLKLVHHDMRKENHKDFWGAIVREKVCSMNGDNPREITSEIILPDEIAKDLINLFSRKTPFTYNNASSSYIKVNGAKLKETEVKHYFY